MRFRNIINFRDISLHGTGPVKNGIIYRSASTDSVSKKDIASLHAAGISSIIDLRSPSEFKKGKVKINGIETLNFPLDFENQTREKLIPLLKEKNSEDKILEVSHNLYLDILDASGPVLRDIIATCIRMEGRPMLIHCQAGKDRTGVIIALIHLIAGTSNQHIINDYLKSNDEIIPYYRKLLIFRKIIRLGFLPVKKILFMIEVKERNIRSVIERIDNHYGGISGFLKRAGVNDSEVSGFRKYITCLN